MAPSALHSSRQAQHSAASAKVIAPTAKVAAALGLVLALLSPLAHAQSPAARTAGSSPPPPSPAGKLSETDLDCIMEAHVTAKLSASVPGLISRVYVDRGDVVHKGDLLAELESDVEKAAVALARTRAENDALIKSNRSRLEFLKRKLARQEKLRSGNIVTEAALDEVETDSRVAEMNAVDAEYNQDIAKQELKRSEAMLRQRRIVSPLDGVVVERLLSAGEYRSEQSQILTIAQIDPLNVEVFVPIAFYGQTAPGWTAEVRPESPVGGRYEATVKVVDRVVDAASGTFGVRLELPNPNHALPAGLRCRIQFRPGPPTSPAEPARQPLAAAKPTD